MTGSARWLAPLVAGLAVVGCSIAQPTPSASSTSAPTASPAASPSATATASLEPSPTSEPDTLGLEPFAAGFEPLVFLANAGDGSGRLFAVEQRGVIQVLDAQGDVADAPILNISERIVAGDEQGLLGLAFHPDFASNGRFFVDYTDLLGNTVVAEFGLTADGMGDPDSERVLLGIDQPFPNHNGGMLAFGPDGYLYIGTGDGGSGGDPYGNGQNLKTLLGKILRIDVDSGDPYGIPGDNPIPALNRGGLMPEIWASGMRNPWRFSFDRLTGAMFIGDVGQDNWEEVDVVPAGSGGRNYGWNTMEGDQCYALSSCAKVGLTLPVAVYAHDLGCAITGGYVYRGSQFADLYGSYVFSDFCTGRLWTLDAQAALDAGSAAIVPLGRELVNPSAFGEDESGEIYLVDLNGAIYHLVLQSG